MVRGFNRMHNIPEGPTACQRCRQGNLDNAVLQFAPTHSRNSIDTMGHIKLIGALAFAGLLAACSAEDQQQTCEGKGKNLLQDPSFSTVGGSRRERQWFQSEHGAGNSFAHSVSNGVLRIEKTGVEPWFLFSQMLERKEIKGKQFVFSAEIKLDVKPDTDNHGFKQGAGLTLTAFQSNKPVVRSMMEHEPHLGTTDWQRVETVVELPMGVEDVRLGFIHQATGVIQVRNPSFKRVPKGECAN